MYWSPVSKINFASSSLDRTKDSRLNLHSDMELTDRNASSHASRADRPRLMPRAGRSLGCTGQAENHGRSLSRLPETEQALTETVLSRTPPCQDKGCEDGVQAHPGRGRSESRGDAAEQISTLQIRQQNQAERAFYWAIFADRLEFRKRKAEGWVIWRKYEQSSGGSIDA